MPTATEYVTRQKVQAVLRMAGFHASKVITTRIRGWYERNEGYSVVQDEAKVITVHHHFDTGRINDQRDHASLRANAIRVYSEAIMAVGIACGIESNTVVIRPFTRVIQ